MIKLGFIFLMVVHGLIHSMGGLDGLNIIKTKGITGESIFPLSPSLHRLVSIAWIVVSVLFLTSATALGLSYDWWKYVAIVSTLLSQAIIVLYWPDAKYGTLPNILVIMGIWWFWNVV